MESSREKKNKNPSMLNTSPIDTKTHRMVLHSMENPASIIILGTYLGKVVYRYFKVDCGPKCRPSAAFGRKCRSNTAAAAVVDLVDIASNCSG